MRNINYFRVVISCCILILCITLLFEGQTVSGKEKLKLEDIYGPGLNKGLLSVGTNAPDFNLPSINGEKISLSSYNKKVVWIVFWNIDCPPSARYIIEMQKIYDRYKDQGLEVIGINPYDDPDRVNSYLREHMISFPQASGMDPAVQQVYRAYMNKANPASPMNYIINREGKVADAWFSSNASRGISTLETLGIK